MAKLNVNVVALCAALAALSVAPAEASAASGDYAKHSAAYAEYIANCKRAATASPKIEDEAAKKLEQLTAAQRSQQIQACQMSEAALAKREQQREASNIPPAAYIGAGAVVGMVAARSLNRRPPSYGGQRLTPEQRAQLDGLRAIESEEVLGPRPANSQGYLGQRRGHQPVPRGCNEVKAPSPDGRTMYVRVVCH